jgi:hypothetical protein
MTTSFSTPQSSTGTVQTGTYETQVLHLVSQQILTPHQSVEALLEKMRASSLFQNELAEKLEACAVEIQSHQNDSEKISILLCRLLFEVISPTGRICASHPVLKGQLDSFEDELKTILQKLLPKGVLVDPCLDRYREVQTVIRKMEIVDQVFQQKLKTLYRHANEQLDLLLNDFQEEQKRIITIHGKNKALHEKAEKELDEKTAEVEALQETVHQTGSALLQLQRNINHHDLALSQTIRSFNGKKGGSLNES